MDLRGFKKAKQEYVGRVWPEGSQAKAKFLTAKAYEPIDKFPDYMGYDRDGVTLKANFQVDIMVSGETSTIYEAYAVPNKHQPTGYDVKKALRGWEFLARLAMNKYKCGEDDERLVIKSIEELSGTTCQVKLGVFTTKDGEQRQCIREILPPDLTAKEQPRPVPQSGWGSDRDAKGWPVPQSSNEEENDDIPF